MEETSCFVDSNCRVSLEMMVMKMDMMTKRDQFKGECLCGKTRYHIKGEPPKAMFFCHCSRCRKETGTVHGANIFFKNAQLIWERGEENCTVFTVPGTRHSRSFCKICGSPLPRIEGDDHLVLPAGTLDDDSFLEPTAHIFMGSRSKWEDQLSDLPKFDELPESF